MNANNGDPKYGNISMQTINLNSFKIQMKKKKIKEINFINNNKKKQEYIINNKNNSNLKSKNSQQFTQILWLIGLKLRREHLTKFH